VLERRQQARRRELAGQQGGVSCGQRPQLDVAPRGQLDPAVTKLPGEPGQRPQLPGRDEAAG
jgi:hypothetical protein